jgi:predicted dehydrogenase
MVSPIKIGVLGLRRGLDLARNATAAGMELVAVCDADGNRLRSAGLPESVTTYTDFQDLLAHDCEAVLLANHFHQHAPFAIRALNAGKHVLSEITACKTAAEGVALVGAAESSDRVYMLAENWQFTAYNQEMRRLFRAGEVGKFLYGEAEYVHPMSADGYKDLSPGIDHWRNWIPATYYCTHSLGPVMYITDTDPVSVNALVIPYDRDDPAITDTERRNDTASVIMARMDNGAIVKLIQFGLRGEGLYTRIHGNRGLMENARHGDQRMLRVKKDRFDDAGGVGYDRLELPEFPPTPVPVDGAGHGGADLFVSLAFTAAVRGEAPPFFDVYRAVAMSMVGIQAYRSALEDGAPVSVPDFRQKADRLAFEGDDWSPDPADRRDGQPWPSVLGDIRAKSG